MRAKAILTVLAAALVGQAALAGGIDIPDSVLRHLTRDQRRELQDRYDRSNRDAENRRNSEDQRRSQQELKKAMKENLSLIKELFKKAEEAFKEESYAIARNYYEDVSLATVKGSEQMVATSKERLAEIEKIGGQRLQDAQLKLIRCEYAAAAEALASIIATFPFTKVCKKAEAKLRILGNTPRAAAAVLYADALAELAAENYPGAVRKLREVVKKYPGEVAAMKSAKRLDELEKDPAVQEALKVDRDLAAGKLCPKWMNMANNYLLNGQKGRAKEYLLRIASQFPGTSYAADAAKKLKEL